MMLSLRPLKKLIEQEPITFKNLWLPSQNWVPFICQFHLRQHILTLCFFAVALFLKKSIKSARTIRSYIRRVKNQWIQKGCDPEILKSDVLERVVKGSRRRLPPKSDTRPAFLLPHYNLPSSFCHPATGQLCSTMAAVIFGFFGLDILFSCLRAINHGRFNLGGYRGSLI